MASKDIIVQQDAFWVVLKFLVNKNSLAKMLPTGDERAVARFLDSILAALRTDNEEVQIFSMKSLYLFSRLVDVSDYPNLKTLIFQVLSLFEGQRANQGILITHGCYFLSNLHIKSPKIEELLMSNSFINQLSLAWMNSQQRESENTADINFVFLKAIKKFSENKKFHNILCKNATMEPLCRVLKAQSGDVKRLSLEIILDLVNNPEAIDFVSQLLKPGDFAMLLKGLQSEPQCLITVALIAREICKKKHAFAVLLCKETLFVRNLITVLKIIVKNNKPNETDSAIQSLLSLVVVLAEQSENSLTLVQFGLYGCLESAAKFYSSSSSLGELITEILMKTTKYYEDFNEVFHTELKQMLLEFLKVPSPRMPLNITDFYMQGARCGYNMREIVTNEVRAAFEKIIAQNSIVEMKFRFDQLKKLIDQQNKLEQKITRPRRDLYHSAEQNDDLGFVKDFIGRDESNRQRDESGLSARLTFDTNSNPERSIIEQLEQHKKIDLDDLIEKCLGINMIVFSKKQRIENATFPLYPNITKNRIYEPTEHTRSPRNNSDAYSQPSYHNEPELPPQRQHQQQQKHKSQVRHEHLEIPHIDARVQTPSFTESKAKRQATEEFTPNSMNAEGFNWYPLENTYQTRHTDPDNPIYKAPEHKRESPFEITINEPRGQKKPNPNKGSSSFMASYLKSLEKTTPGERSNSFHEDNSMSRTEDGPFSGEQDEFIRHNQQSVEGKVFQQRPPSVDNGRRRPSKNSIKTNTSASQISKQRDPSQQQTLYNDVDDDFDLERVRREYENTEINHQKQNDPNRQSNTSNVSRLDGSRNMNQRDLRPRETSSDPEMNHDASLTRVGSNNMIKGKREKSPILENPRNADFVEIISEGQRSSEGFRKDAKLALPAVASFPIHKLDGVDRIIEEGFYQIDFTNKDDPNSKSLRHHLTLGVPEAKGIYKITNCNTIESLIFWFSQGITTNDNNDVISELQKGIGSSMRTGYLVALLVAIGERKGISFESLRRDPRYKWA